MTPPSRPGREAVARSGPVHRGPAAANPEAVAGHLVGAFADHRVEAFADHPVAASAGPATDGGR